LVAGENLYTFLQRHGRLSQRSTIDIGCQLCDVLDAAHSMGFVHRDLKPENIMVVASEGTDPRVRIKVLDFGVVKFLPEHRRSRLPGESIRSGDDDDAPDSRPASLTQFGMTVGTPTHMAPEQALSSNVDTRADLYTAGVLLFEISTGVLPFNAKNPIEVARMHLKDRPPSPRGIVSEIHPELETVILRCLEKDPSDRWQTARELGRQLARVAVILDTEGDPTAERYTPSVPILRSLQPQRSTMPTMRGLDEDEPAEGDDGLSLDVTNAEALRHPLPPVDLEAGTAINDPAQKPPEPRLNAAHPPSVDALTAHDRWADDGLDSTVRSSPAIVILLLLLFVLGGALVWFLL
ncbi:MAG: serine/threonine-protein kinase, partial [Polyangiaceae bacterium]